MVSDDSIIKRLHSRDESALQDICTLYGSICYQIAFRILDNHEDAEECVNDMLLGVWDSIPPHLPMSLQAYLITLVHRSAINKVKHEQRQKRSINARALPLDELSDIIPSDEQLESIVEQRELIQILTRFLDTLKSQPRHIFMQRYFMMESYETIADSNNISENAVKMSLSRTRRQLRKFLRKEGML